jgi:hypothetical protein
VPDSVVVHSSELVTASDCTSWCNFHDPLGDCDTIEAWMDSIRSCEHHHSPGDHRNMQALESPAPESQ